jgi:cytochrome c-type biogenesis protein CcmH/NrfF
VAPPKPQSESLAREIANEMPSPYCPGRSIASCPTEAARKLEEDILGQVEQGVAREEIEDGLVARFGAETMGVNPGPWLAISLTAVGLLAALLLGRAARRWARKSPEATIAAAGVVGASAVELQSLSEELEDMDGLD